MKATLHGKICGIGEDIFKTAFVSKGWPAPRLGAFSEGNWIMDFSQVLDPVAMAKLKRSAREIIHSTFRVLNRIAGLHLLSGDNLISFGIEGAFRKVSSWWGLDVSRPLDPVGVAHEVLAKLEKILMQSTELLDPAELGTALRETCRVIGFYKFVHPVTNMDSTGPDSGRSIDFRAYMFVFDELFGQYYPHLHLDRPEILSRSTREHSCYAADIDPELRMYSYMRQHIQLAASEFARFDKNVAHPTFRGGIKPDFNSLAFNLALARCGAACHLVEDFFAHSTFVEQAALALGPKYLDWKESILGDHTPSESASPIQTKDRVTVVRRLMRQTEGHTGDSDAAWVSPHVVTGYFDGRDTLVSLFHLCESFIGKHDSKGLIWVLKQMGLAKTALFVEHVPVLARANSEDKWDAEIREFAAFLANPVDSLESPEKVIRDVLAVFADPSEAFEDSNNELAQKLITMKGKVEIVRGRPLDPRVSGILLANSGLPEPIKTSFIKMVESWTRVCIIGGCAISLYKVIKLLIAMFRSPGKLIGALLKGALLNPVFNEIVKVLSAQAKEIVQNELLGSNRIGCHSLLAKDNGDEPMHNHAMNCAKAVHRYIVETLTRQSRPIEVEACRALPTGGPTPERTTIDTRHWVDFQELLLFFLRHPVRWDKEYSNAILEVSEPYISDGRLSLVEVVERFRKTAISPNRFSYTALKNANPLLLQNVDEREILAAGAVLSVPNQARKIPKPVVDKLSAAWWRPIFARTDIAVKTESLLDDETASEVDLEKYHTTVPVNIGRVDELIQQGESLGRKLEGEYNLAG